MPAISDKVIYYTIPENENDPSLAVPATITGISGDEFILFLMGVFAIGYVVAAVTQEPAPGFFMEITP